MMTREEELRAQDQAQLIALVEIVRVVVGEVFFDDDRQVFRRRLAVLEKTSIDSITNRQLWANSIPDQETYIKEAAANYVTSIFSSIRHPNDVHR
ncbi:hypothetical protein [Afipia sp. P52-10]|uniref:hypothetical protein n=1 Tax=Afipia sp. P52-10 TaxID=1429916 RepID=UPI000550B878|nr:hypothetical protein [Afipia sp. P52-10]